MIETDKANRFALAADLGLDQILVYRFDAKSGALTPASRPTRPSRPARARAISPSPPTAATSTSSTRSTSRSPPSSTPAGSSPNTRRCPAMPGGAEPTPADSGAEIARPPERPLRLHVAARPRQHRGLRARRRHRPPHAGRARRVRRKDPARLRDRSQRAVDARGEPALRFARRVRDRPKTGRLTPTGQTAEVGAPVSVVFGSATAR